MPQIFVWGILFTGILAIITSLFANKNDFIVFGFCFLFLAVGILRAQISEFNIANDKLAKLNDRPDKITLIGVVSNGPDLRDTSQKLDVKTGCSTILVTVDRYPEYHYLDKVKITGKLEAPMVFDDFNYKNYLLKDGIYSVMGFPKIELAGKEKPNVIQAVYSGILWFKEKLRDSIYQNYLPPQSLILEGIILGNNKTMTQDLRDKLNVTGLRYLTAISGVHVIILSAILMSFLLMLGFHRYKAFYFSIIFIWIYIILTGFTASGIRAATMGSIFLTAQRFGRQNTSSRTITIAAALMLLQNPLLLIYDIGFQLSYLASLGIIYVKPIIDYFLKIITKEKLKNLSDMVSVTITAQLATLPVMIYNFGTIPLVSPITNLLVIPIMQMLMIFGFLSSILGIVSNALGFIFSVPCIILLTYFIKVLDIFSAPWMSKTIQNVSWLWLAGYYLLGILIAWFLNKKIQKFL